MELEFQNMNYGIVRRVVHEARTQDENIDLIVPDSYPDAARIVKCCGSAILRGKECRDGSMTLTGGVRAAVLYVGEEDPQVRVMDAYVPFSARFDNPAFTEQMQVICRCSVPTADARIVNSRKIGIKLSVLFEVDGFQQQTQTICTVADAPECLQMQTQSYAMLQPAQTAEKSFSAAEEITLPSGMTASRVCCYDTRAKVTECKMAGSKAVFRGVICLSALVMDAEQALHHVQQEIPFSQYCEMSEDFDEQELQVTMCVTGAELEPDSASQGKLLLMNVQLLAQCLVSTIKTVELCEDAYCVKAQLQPQWAEMEFEGRLDRQMLHSTVNATAAAETSEVIDATAGLGTPRCERNGGSVHILVPVYFQVLYRDRDGLIRMVQSNTEAKAETVLAEHGTCIVQADACRVSALTGAGQIELRCEVEMDVQSFAKQSLHCLCGGTIEPVQAKGHTPSVIIRRCQERQRLWDLAKQYGTTADAIRAANHINGEQIPTDAMLLIPM